MIAYPASFPCASRIEGHSAAISAGLVRTPMNAGNSRQRRAYRNLPHRISMVFVMPQTIWADWLTWVNVNAWDGWIEMKLPGLVASRQASNTAPITIRFCSDLATELLPVHRLWYWRARVEAEWNPTPAQLALLQGGAWIIGGTPPQPSPDWVIGKTPPDPAPDFTNPGTPATPVVLA